MYPDSMFMATKSGRLPLQMAAALTSDHRTTGDHLVRTLLSMADTKAEWAISHSDRSGRTVLEDAIVANQVNLVAWLIQTCRAADPTRQDALGRNVWHHAAMVGHVAMLQKLGQWAILRPLLNAADTWDSWTPLMYAAKNGHLECVQCLLGGLLVDPTKRDKLGRTAKDLGTEKESLHRTPILTFSFSISQRRYGTTKRLSRFWRVEKNESWWCLFVFVMVMMTALGGMTLTHGLLHPVSLSLSPSFF